MKLCPCRPFGARSTAVQVAAALGFFTLAACGRPEGEAAQPRSPVSSRSSLTSLPTLNTLIAQSLQIDQANPATLDPRDANLFTGADPADNTGSFNIPTGGPSPFIDWHDLGSDIDNHRLVDVDLASGKDPDSFPQSNECVGASNVLSKMDLRYIAAANNNTYAYFAVLRSNNNGDAGYYWLFTRLQPKLNAGQAPCNASQSRLLYDISVGDVLLGGHFHPNGTPLLRIFTAKTSANNVTAVNAINFQNGALWQENSSGVAAVAVNTTITAPGAFETAGAIATSGANLDSEVFAEAAVPVNIFTGGNNCGAVFFGSVITRSSGSGGTSPDLKDLAGPAVFNFGNASATAQLTPTCTLDVNYAVTSITGPLGDSIPIGSATCSWIFDNDPSSTATGCTGVKTLSAGSHTASVTVSNIGSSSACDATATTAPVQAFAELTVDAGLTPTCLSKFLYSATTSGGSGNTSLSWSFTGGGSVSPSSSTSASGEVEVGTGNVQYQGAVTATDTRPDGLVCTADDMAPVVPQSPIQVNLALVAPAPVCPAMNTDGDDVTYQATVSGGTGTYTLAWNGAACSGSACTIDPSDSTFCHSQSVFVTASDDSALCPAATSETETYSKVTTVTGTDN
jgi:hypothetical protein